jgi:hypothetical protein
LQGGARYLGGTLESYGNNSTADALLAIQQSVFEQKWLTAESSGRAGRRLAGP